MQILAQFFEKSAWRWPGLVTFQKPGLKPDRTWPGLSAIPIRMSIELASARTRVWRSKEFFVHTLFNCTFCVESQRIPNTSYRWFFICGIFFSIFYTLW